MAKITETPRGLQVRIPLTKVVIGVTIAGENLMLHSVEAKKVIPDLTSRPFDSDILVEELQGKKLSGRAQKALSLMNQPTRILSASALDEFLLMSTPQEMAGFFVKHGHLVQHAPTDVIPIAEVEKLRQTLIFLLRFARALTDQAEDHLQEYMKQAKAMGLELTRNPSRFLSSHLTKFLVYTVPVMVATDAGIEAAILCPDVWTGLYVLLFDSFAHGLPWSICGECGKLFRMDRLDKKFCSEVCQRKTRQRRYLAKKKTTLEEKINATSKTDSTRPRKARRS